jgi:hypothetical protein
MCNALGRATANELGAAAAMMTAVRGIRGPVFFARIRAVAAPLSPSRRKRGRG